jgi:hypothetical protein
MRMYVCDIFLAVALCGFSGAQGTTQDSGAAAQTQNPMPSPAASSTSAQPGRNTGIANIRIAPGSVIPVQLTKSIDAKKVKTGDEVDAEVTEDLKAGNGEIIVPKNTKVIGRVTEAQARNKEQKESQVGIAFDRAVMKNGGDVALPMSIQAIVGPSYLTGGNNGSSPEGTAQPSTTPSTGGMSPGNSRAGSMGAPQPANPGTAAGEGPTNTSGNNVRQPITGNTQGVLGIPNLTLSTTANSTQGSVVSSEKNNVKLEGGTLLLLRVNQ